MPICHTLCRRDRWDVVTLRERQTELTRSTIIRAATDLIFGQSDGRDFTMQQVADLAGVSHRTLYRHFASREELINAVGRSWDLLLEEGDEIARLPQTFDEWISRTPRLVAFARTHDAVLRRAFLLSFSTGAWRTDRDEHYWTLFRERFPHLPEDEAREDFAAFRQLYSAASCLQLGERFGLDGPGVVAAVDRGAKAMIADIAERDRRAAEATG